MPTIRTINQRQAKKSLPPYDKPFNPQKLPHVVDDAPGKVVIFDGWQNLPPQDINPEQGVEQAFTRAISIQRRQIMNRVTYHHERLGCTMIVDAIVDPFKVREDNEKKARQNARKSFTESKFPTTDDDED